MKICIFGAGAIGGMIGSLLQNNGKEVTLIARGKHQIFLLFFYLNGTR